MVALRIAAKVILLIALMVGCTEAMFAHAATQPWLPVALCFIMLAGIAVAVESIKRDATS